MCLRCDVQQNLILALCQHVETLNKYLTSERNARAARELREEINFAEGWVGSHGNKQTPGPPRLPCRVAPRVTQAVPPAACRPPMGTFLSAGPQQHLISGAPFAAKITCRGEGSVLHEDVPFLVV